LRRGNRPWEVDSQSPPSVKFALSAIGAIAQLGERLHGMQEVVGSIPTSSTKLHGLTVMHRFGQLAVYLGILLVAVGLIGGFAAMFRDADDLAVNLLVLVPLGFVALLTGVVVTQLHRPGNQR
jgi:hypothetical protein